MAKVQNISPFVYINITDENIEKYICNDYASLQPQKNWDDYKEEIEAEYSDRIGMEHEPEEYVPAIIEWDQTKVYFDINNLEVYS